MQNKYRPSVLNKTLNKPIALNWRTNQVSGILCFLVSFLFSLWIKLTLQKRCSACIRSTLTEFRTSRPPRKRKNQKYHEVEHCQKLMGKRGGRKKRIRFAARLSPLLFASSASQFTNSGSQVGACDSGMRAIAHRNLILSGLLH